MAGFYAFDNLIEKCPPQLKTDIFRLKLVQQRPDKHPEGNGFIHTQQVVDRLAVYKDITLSLAGIFHDLGKFDTQTYNQEKKFHQQPGHEKESIKYVERFKKWIINMGADYDIVYGIVAQHMRLKVIDNMKQAKQDELMQLHYFDLLRKFSECD